MNKNSFLKRVRNPVFLLAIAGLIYQAIEQSNIKIELETYKQLVDVITYILIGTGIYSTFDKEAR